MHGDWRRFLESLPVEVVIHHKDDFEEAYPGHGIALPAVLIADGDNCPRNLLSAAELDGIADTAELMGRVEKQLINVQASNPDIKIVS